MDDNIFTGLLKTEWKEETKRNKMALIPWLFLILQLIVTIKPIFWIFAHTFRCEPMVVHAVYVQCTLFNARNLFQLY